MDNLSIVLPLLLAGVSDAIWGDPSGLPHPVVAFGKVIVACEHRYNRVDEKGHDHRFRNGTLVALSLILGTALLTFLLVRCAECLSPWLAIGIVTAGIFYGLAGTTLIREVREVFRAADRSLDEGRRQVARIVGRDTSDLSDREVRTAALETLAENLSDGVVAPLFWFLLGGLPGMMTYKMVNTLDSMIGYRNERYALFGKTAARLDDVFNWVPARLTAFLMILVGGFPSVRRMVALLRFVKTFGRCHASPNSGYPEAALAGILDVRFGGPHYYFGEWVPKPYIGTRERDFTTEDLTIALRVNRVVGWGMLLAVMLLSLLLHAV